MIDKSLYKSVPVKSSEITPKHLFQSRRQFLKSMGILGAGAFLAACSPDASPQETAAIQPQGTAAVQPRPAWQPTSWATRSTATKRSPTTTTTTSSPPISARWHDQAKDFKTSPWQVEVYGLVNKPKTFGLEDLLKLFHPGRAHLPPALRRSLVDGHPLDGFPAVQAAQTGRAAVQRQLRALRDADGSRADARPEEEILSLALPGRADASKKP